MPMRNDTPGKESSDGKPSGLEPEDLRNDDLITCVRNMRNDIMQQMDSLELLIKQRETGSAHSAVAPVAHMSDKATTAVTPDVKEQKNANEVLDVELLHEDITHGSLSQVDMPAFDTSVSSTSLEIIQPEKIDTLPSDWHDIPNHRLFRGLVMFAVCANAATMGFSLEWSTYSTVWFVCGHIFTAFFALEMALKLACLGVRSYFSGSEAMWNILDFGCAWTGMIGSWVVPLVTGNDNEYGATVFRLLRVLRLAKLAHANKNLAVLAEGMIASLKSLVWVAVLLVVFLYAFAVGLIMNGIGNDETIGSHWNPQYFGTLFRAMVSLFGVCIGAEWTSIIWPVVNAGRPGTMLVFVAFIFIAQFGFLNIIVGVIVDRTSAATQKQNEEEAQEQLLQQMSVVRKLGAKMKKGGLTFDEFTSLLLAPENQELRMIVKRDLPKAFRARDLHSILEDDADGKLTRKEFEDGVERLISATPFQDRIIIQHRQAKLMHEFQAHSASLRTEIRGVLAELKSYNLEKKVTSI